MTNRARTTSAGSAPTSAQLTDVFAIGYGDTISDGVPGPGAGNIEAGGDQDVYTFEGAAGDQAIFDVLAGSAGRFRWDAQAPDGSALFDGLFTDRSVALPQTGTYTVAVRGANAATTGTYSFSLLLSPPPELFAIHFGDTVSEGVPAAGAGNVESPGARDVYSFDAAAGQTAIFDLLDGANTRLAWSLTAPDGTTLFDSFVGDRQLTLPATGTYTLTVKGLNIDDSDTYSFQLLEVPPTVEEFTIAFGDTVADGVPAPGAGNLEVPGAIDEYRVDATAGQVAVLHVLDGDNTVVRWSLRAPDGATVFDDFFVDQEVVLTQTGTHTLTVRGLQVTDVGTCSFQLLEASPNQPPTLVAIADQQNIEGAAITLAVEAEDPDGNALTFSADGLPAGLAIDAGTGEIAGVIAEGAADESPYTVEVTVTDPDGASASTEFQWTVTARETGPLPVEVDVIPHRIVNDGHGLIPVVIFGTADVAAGQINARTVELEGMPIVTILGVPLAIRWGVNHDRHRDLIVLIKDVAGAIPTGVTAVTVTARLLDGTQIAGTDEVDVVTHDKGRHR